MKGETAIMIRSNANGPQAQTISPQGAAALHDKQRRFLAEITESETALKAAKQKRDDAGLLPFLIGLSCLIALPVLVLLNAAQDAPVLEFLLGIQGSDPWDTPLGKLQPLAIGASIAVVIAMGLAALLALGLESQPK
jgi:hypothetical protein